MTANGPAADASSGTGPGTRRERAVARVLDPARLRAETRVQRFLDAAMQLMNSDTGKDFTVQEVVERSGQSLRSFYQYFDGKHELLLALFEDAVRTTAEHLRDTLAGERAPLERLHRFTVEYYRVCRPIPKGRSTKSVAPNVAIGEFAHQLLTEHPQEAARAFVPLVTLLEELLDGAQSAGALRADLNHRRIAGILLQAIMFNAFATTISSASDRKDVGDPAEQMWDLLLNGIGARRTG